MGVETKAILVFFAFLIIWYVPPILYFTLGWFKKWFHDVLKWHRPDMSIEEDICKYCGKKIMQDSQGNWFSWE